MSSCKCKNYDYKCLYWHTAREGTPRRHEPPICRHEPLRFARQTEPPLYSKEQPLLGSQKNHEV